MGSIPANTRPLTGPAPALKAPAGATDCHIHLYLPGFEPQPGGPPVAELATVEDYAVVQKRLGLERVILTQSNAYQFDNGSTLAALEQIGPERARAVIAVSPNMTVSELERLHARGVRGARIMNLPGGAVKIADMKPVERLCRSVGWSMIVQFNGREIDRHIDALRSIEADYVIDHIGKFIDPVPADDPRLDEILRLIDRGNAWFKICGCYETSLTGAPDFADVAAIATRVVNHAPERIIWGSNWPHVGVPRERYPDDAVLLDILLGWATPDQRQKILVDNPARLYGF
ncbi:amidohydrolase [Microvirga vignae]|uniref:Amidohydrolase n=1 Tax=Microvirga vignae TaxID=1225564 RepID=A0A0H1RHG2_9HYPH|nr:amidohydrolase family protein [Microvirga vignae]KLK94499.1 amidohydrolase [Microvirga vignae]